ncbi:hypothetical protein ABK040_013767 [Willaertia magna]
MSEPLSPRSPPRSPPHSPGGGNHYHGGGSPRRYDDRRDDFRRDDMRRDDFRRDDMRDDYRRDDRDDRDYRDYRRGPPPQEVYNMEEQEKKASTTLFVGRIPYQFTEKEIKEKFDKFGEITEITLGVTQNGRSLGYCFIKFKNREDAEQAFDAVKNGVIPGEEGASWRVDFDIGKDKKRELGFPGRGRGRGGRRFGGPPHRRGPPGGGGGRYSHRYSPYHRRSPPYGRGPPLSPRRSHSPPPPYSGGGGRFRRRSPPPMSPPRHYGGGRRSPPGPPSPRQY